MVLSSWRDGLSVFSFTNPTPRRIRVSNRPITLGRGDNNQTPRPVIASVWESLAEVIGSSITAVPPVSACFPVPAFYSTLTRLAAKLSGEPPLFRIYRSFNFVFTRVEGLARQSELAVGELSRLTA